jgi:hypothetical protein
MTLVVDVIVDTAMLPEFVEVTGYAVAYTVTRVVEPSLFVADVVHDTAAIVSA